MYIDHDGKSYFYDIETKKLYLKESSVVSQLGDSYIYNRYIVLYLRLCKRWHEDSF